MLIIPAAVHIRLRADADDQPKGPSVVTPRVGVGLGMGMLNCHQRVNLRALVTTTVKILRVVAVRLTDLCQLPANGWSQISRRSRTR
jgi:hypothetical protein